MAEPSPELRAVWDLVPDFECKGLCTSACGPVEGNREERALLKERGIRLRSHALVMLDVAVGADVEMCPALVDHRCTVYDVRPTICRLWGAGPAMACPWGCSPREPVSIRRSAEILAKSWGQWLPPDIELPVLRPRIEPLA